MQLPIADPRNQVPDFIERTQRRLRGFIAPDRAQGNLPGNWYQVYRRHVRPRLPKFVERALHAASQSSSHHTVRQILDKLEVWRVSKPITKILGPQYKRSRRNIEIDITYACNLNCFNCNRSCQQASTNDSMSIAQIEQFVRESKEQNVRWDLISILGGEPTVHPDFFQILDIFRNYRDTFSPGTMVQVTSNGHGDHVNAVLEKIPSDVFVTNTAKQSQVQPLFESFNVAPKDRKEYANADFRNGCWVSRDCGFGLGPTGYYPCAVAGGIDRIMGFDAGRKSLPPDSDAMDDLLEKFCQNCGLFKRHHGTHIDGPNMSPTWVDAYAKYKRRKPRLTLYGEAPPKKVESSSAQESDTNTVVESTGCGNGMMPAAAASK